jgi:hypothetical protein
LSQKDWMFALLRFAWITRKKQSSGVVSCLNGLA